MDRQVRRAGEFLMRVGITLLALALTGFAPVAAAQTAPAMIDATGVEAPAAPGRPYAAGSRPDRIILSPGEDAARSMAVAWRTSARQTTAVAELVRAVDAPGFAEAATSVAGVSFAMRSENGPATYHQVRFDDLEPGTTYYYRVRGGEAWSEWLQFRTASAEPEPLRLIYLGDVQNRILDVGSLAFRQAILSAGSVDLMLHAGDLVASRDDMIHDDEWGQWTEAGGYALAMIPQVPAAGNHEYVDLILPDGSESRRLAPHWPISFALPANGAPGAEATSYAVDYPGLRVIVLDGTAALDLGQLESQTQWLDARLAESSASWKIVLFHQPLFTCARPRDTEPLKAAWKPLLERHRVDLVLQGHDHCYARLTSEAGREAGAAARADGARQGPVYLVSVTGSKMYGLNDRSGSQPDRVAEDTRLYQIIDLDANRLSLRSYTATGRLYDGFNLIRDASGNRLEELDLPLPKERRCRAGRGPDGMRCTSDPKD